MKKKMMMIALTGGLLLSVTACNGVGAANSGTVTKTVVTTTSSATSGTSVTIDSSTTGRNFLLCCDRNSEGRYVY